ncbi:MAG: hypothetical protein INQ03_05990 [Candidatus Heimdallarchaeota archaeon]|nr:hypothetical protein [Candidatus Heimdallarchaeota archaeon]
MKREPGRLMRIIDIYNRGKIIEFDGKKYFQMDDATLVKRVRLFGTCVARYDKPNEENEEDYSALTIDDGSDTIRIKVWSRPFKRQDGSMYNQYDLVNNIKVGDMIDILGKVREWENEFYVIPDQIAVKNDISWEINRRSKLFSLDVDQYGLNPQDEAESGYESDYEGEESMEMESDLSEVQRFENSFSSNVDENSLELLITRSGLNKDQITELIKEYGMDGKVLNPKPGYYLLT